MQSDKHTDNSYMQRLFSCKLFNRKAVQLCKVRQPSFFV